MNWTVCIPTLKRYDLLVRLCSALDTNECVGLLERLVILDNGGCLSESSDWHKACIQFTYIRPELVVPKYNFGVAGSWNFFSRT